MLSANEGNGNGGDNSGGLTNTSSGNNSSSRQRQQKDKEREQRRAEREAGNRGSGGGNGKARTKRKNPSSINTLVFNPFFILFLGLLTVSCLISFFLVFSHPEGVQPGSSNQEGGQVLMDAYGRRIPPKPNDENQRRMNLSLIHI